VGFLRRRPEAAPFDEEDAYERLHGERSGDIRVVEVEPPEPEPELDDAELTGESLRRAFELRLDARE